MLITIAPVLSESTGAIVCYVLNKINIEKDINRDLTKYDSI